MEVVTEVDLGIARRVMHIPSGRVRNFHTLHATTREYSDSSDTC